MIKIALIFLLVGLQNPPPSSGEEKQPPKNQAQDKESEASVGKTTPQSSTRAAPEGAPNLNAITSQNRTENTTNNEDDEPSQEWWLKSKWCAVWFACLAIVVGGAQFAMYWRQWCIMRKSLIYATASSRRAIKQAKDSAKEALDHSRESTEKGLRAYLSVLTSIHDLPNATSAKLVKPPEGFSIMVKNTGQTPAYKVQSFMTWNYFNGANVHWPENVAFKNAKEIDAMNPDPRGSTDTIGGGQMLQVDARFDPNKKGPTFSEAYAKLMANLASLYVYGELTYEDAFGKPHRTEFCVRFRFTPDHKNRPEWATGSITYTTYDKHNNAD